MEFLLRVAVKQGNLGRVEEALRLPGVNPNVKASRDITSHTPLTLAVEHDKLDIVKLLLKHPACDPNMKVKVFFHYSSALIL